MLYRTLDPRAHIGVGFSCCKSCLGHQSCHLTLHTCQGVILVSMSEYSLILHQRPATSSWWCSPLPNGDRSKWLDRSPEGLDQKVAPIFMDYFSLGCLLTDHNWAAPFLIDRTPLQHLLILVLLLISGNVYPNPGPIRNNPRPRYPCSICHFGVGRDSLQCSTCLNLVHFHCSSLTRADFRTICATGTAVGWRCPACCPQSQTGSPTQTDFPVTTPASPPSPPQGFPHYHLAFINRILLRAPQVTPAPCAFIR